MNRDDSCTNTRECSNMGDEPKESNRFMNQSGKYTKNIHESNLYFSILWLLGSIEIEF